MRSGIVVFNDKRREILSSEDPPFRFVTAAEPFDVVPMSNRYRFRKDITGRYSSSSMIYVEVPEAIRPLWGSESTRGHYRVAVEGGITYLYLTSGGWDLFSTLPGQVPVFYIVDRLRPPQQAAGFGLNISDASGSLINSSTPLAQVEDIMQATPAAAGFDGVATFGPASGRICIVENVAGGLSMSKYRYPGGGGVTISQWYSIDTQIVGGTFQTVSVFWDEETGQSPTRTPWIIPLRCILLKRPSKPYGW